MSLKIESCWRKLYLVDLFNSCFVLILVYVTTVVSLDAPSSDLYIYPPFEIVGGGTAGCVLARRLSDNGAFKVLLLESGGLPKKEMEIPGNAPLFLPNPDVTFRYPSIPQRYASRQTNGIVEYIGGRMLGGSSSLNYMWFNRGHPNDWDNWANITHDDTWRYKNMLKYFKKSETYMGDFPSDQHGYNGPITVSRPKYAPGLDYWLAAGKELGYPVADPNGPQKRSFGPIEFSKRHGRRVSSFTGYLSPVLFSRPNLYIFVNTNVTKIIFDGVVATGVQFQTVLPGSSAQNGPTKFAYAKKEVIVCAGVIGSPLLLQRSGLGPREILEAAKIPVVRDLPVGMHFQDHVNFFVPVHINNALAVLNETRDYTPENLQLFKLYGDGPYSNTGGSTGQAFDVSSTAISEGKRDWPDIQIYMLHSAQPFGSGFPNFTSNDFYSDPSAIPMSTGILLGRPKSRGSVFVNPNDIYGLPLLDMGYLSDPKDMQSLLEGVKKAVRIFEATASYRRLGARIVKVDYPACQNRVFKSDQYWKCYIRQASSTGLHAGGTCRMGFGISDPNAVVDSRLKVNGISALRVADASIMPVLTNSNTQAAVYGIAEKAADMILNYWLGLSSV